MASFAGQKKWRPSCPAIVDFCFPPQPTTMFRTPIRRFAATAWRAAESVAEIDAAQQYRINVSKAQGICQRGLIDGMLRPQLHL